MPRYIKESEYTPQKGDKVIGYTFFPKTSKVIKFCKKHWFKIAVVVLISYGYVIWDNEEPKPTNQLTNIEEQANHFFFNTGTASTSFTETWKSIYFEQANHLIGCRKYYAFRQDENNAKFCRLKYRNLLGEARLQLGIGMGIDKPVNQYDIYYGFDSEDGVYISQDSGSHYAANRLLSIDIATGGKKLPVYAMDCQLEMCEFKVSTKFTEGKGETLILTNEEKNMQFRYGHTHLTTDKDTVITAEEVGIILCPEDENAGITTGCHLDFSFWSKSNGNWIQAEYKDDKHYDPEKRIEDLIIARKEISTIDTDTHLAAASELYKGYDTPWQILSSKHFIESGRQKIQPKVSSAGAKGQMQFMPCTWFNYGADPANPIDCFTVINITNAYSGKYPSPRGYGIDGDGDGVADINNLKDALASADKHFQANLKATGSIEKAIFQYNHSDYYVNQVMIEAKRLGL